MPHRHRVHDIASQSGLSEATVDRVLHGRAHVSPRAVRAVDVAIADLDRQAAQILLAGRNVVVDLVMAAPRRFTEVVREAVEAELPGLRPALVRLRHDLRNSDSPDGVAERLMGVAARGSDGVLLKAPDRPDVRAAVDALVDAGIPVVTLVTDLPTTRRHAHVGIDDAAAGATAAYLLDLALGAADADVLVPLSRADFLGEARRADGFEAEFGRLRPRSGLVRVDGTDGLDATVEDVVTGLLAGHPRLRAVYSIGGANRGILSAFDRADRPVRAYVAHDLDGDNLDLLRRRRLTVVLHHDLRADARRALRGVLQVRGLLPGRPASVPSAIHVVTPHNTPTRI